MSFSSVFSDIHKNSKNFAKWEQQQADNDAKREKYFKQHKPSQQELKEADEFGRTIVDAIDFMDTQSEDKAESVELAFESTQGTVVGLISMIPWGIMEAKSFLGQQSFEKDKSKVNNFIKRLDEQSLNELKKHSMVVEKNGGLKLKSKLFNKTHWADLSNELQESLGKNISNETIKTHKSLSKLKTQKHIIPALVGFVAFAATSLAGTVYQIKSSRVARFQAREELKDPRNFVEYTDSQKTEAESKAKSIKIKDEKDKINQRGIFDFIKDIKSLKKDYKAYQNESALLDKIKLSNMPDKDVDKAYKRQRVLNRSIKKINNQAEEYSENMETAAAIVIGSSFAGGIILSKITDGAVALYKKIARPVKKGVINKPGKNDDLKIIAKEISKVIKPMKGFVAGTFASMIAAIITTDLQKDAARAGRFKAKRELEENKTNFIDVSQKELDKIDAKGTVKKDNFITILKFIPEAFKTMKEYKHYKKTELKKKKAIAEALKEAPLSAQQVENAKALQTRVFKSFDTIDNYSQEYGEDMEAATEISTNAISTIIPLITTVPLITAASNPQKAAIFATNIAKQVTKKFSKFTQKYTENLSGQWVSKLTEKIENTSLYKTLEPLEKDINTFLKETDDEKASYLLEALKPKISKELNNPDDLNFLAKELEHFRKYPSQKATIEMAEGALDIFKLAFIPKCSDPKALEDLMEEFAKTSNHSKAKYIKEEMLTLFPEEKTNNPEFIDEFETGLNSMKKLRKLIEFVKDPVAAKEKFEKELTKNIENKDKEAIVRALDDTLDNVLNMNAMLSLGVEDINFGELSDAKLFKVAKNLKEVLENVPTEQLKKAYQAEDDAFSKINPTKGFVKQQEKIDLSSSERFITKDLAPIAYTLGGAYLGGSIALSYGLQSWFASLQKKAGRLGTMSAINELNQENEKFKQTHQSHVTQKQSKQKVQTITLPTKPGTEQKTKSHFELLRKAQATKAS